MGLALPRYLQKGRPKRKLRSTPSRRERGVSIGGDTFAFLPASTRIRPINDQMIVEPLEVCYSKVIFVEHQTEPLRGIVKAVGPGHYPWKYDHPEKHKRTKMVRSKYFQPTDCKVGDVVRLEGFKFEQFWWGDKIHLHCREADIAAIETE